MLYIIAKEDSVTVESQPNVTLNVITEQVSLDILTNTLDFTNKQQIKVNFSYGDAAPKTIATLQGLITRTRLVIFEPFNSSDTLLRLGYDSNPNALMSPTDIKPSTVAEYEKVINVQRYTPTTIKLFMELGEGTTQGNGCVIIESI